MNEICVTMADHFASRRHSLKNKFGDRMIKQTHLLQNILICQWQADPLFADCSPLTNHDISLNLVQLLLTISTFALDMQCNIRSQPMLMQLWFATNWKSQRIQSNRKSWFPYNLLTDCKVSREQKRTATVAKTSLMMPMNSNSFKLYREYSNSSQSANISEIPRDESLGNTPRFTERERNIRRRVLAPYIKCQVREIRAAIVQWRQRNGTNMCCTRRVAVLLIQRRSRRHRCRLDWSFQVN